MRNTILLVLFSLPAVAQSWTLCAAPGPLQVNQGEPLVFGRHSSPAFWGFTREVQYQVCSLDGRAVRQRVELDLVIEPLDGEFPRESLASQKVTTDARGRFTAAYGSGGRQPGAAWPEGVVSRERHRFVAGGQTVVTFILERSARDLRVVADSRVATAAPRSPIAGR
jgi:hypothetical protein